MVRFRSQQEDSFAGKVVAALRNEFGGHAVTKRITPSIPTIASLFVIFGGTEI